MNLAAIGYLYAMQTVELGKEGVWILLDVCVVVLQDFAEEFMFGVVYGLDDVFVVPREIEEASALSRRAKLGEDVLAC
jgi:hypothetical protein